MPDYYVGFIVTITEVITGPPRVIKFTVDGDIACGGGQCTYGMRWDDRGSETEVNPPTTMHGLLYIPNDWQSTHEPPSAPIGIEDINAPPRDPKWPDEAGGGVDLRDFRYELGKVRNNPHSEPVLNLAAEWWADAAEQGSVHSPLLALTRFHGEAYASLLAGQREFWENGWRKEVERSRSVTAEILNIQPDDDGYYSSVDEQIVYEHMPLTLLHKHIQNVLFRNLKHPANEKALKSFQGVFPHVPENDYLRSVAKDSTTTAILVLLFDRVFSPMCPSK